MEPNAVQDILEGARFEGMIETIRPVTDAVDIVFSTVITFVAFFIISVALLRNVLAGAYCAFPIFWDHVHKAHEGQKDKKFFDAITGLKDSYKEVSMSSIKTLFFTILPDIKCLTDFKDDTKSPKAYFVKAIPQMIIVVIIGVFIYNGYYRDATSIIASTGAEIIERTVLSFDPMGAFDTIMNTSGRPSFATDNAVTTLDKNKNKIASEIYSQIITKYTDIKDANSKADLASEIDSAVDAILGTNNAPIDKLSEYFSAEDGSWSTTIRVELSKDFDPNNYMNVADPDKKQFCWKIGLGREDNHTSGEMPDGCTASSSGDLDIMFDSTTDAAKNEEWYIRVMARATRNVVATSTKDVHVDITVPASEAGTSFTLTSGSSATNVIGIYGKAEIVSTTNGFTIKGTDTGTYTGNKRFTLVSSNDMKGVTVIIDSITIGAAGTTPVNVAMNDNYVRYYDVSCDSRGNFTAQRRDTPTGGGKKDEGGNPPENAAKTITLTVGSHGEETTYTFSGLTATDTNETNCAGITVQSGNLVVPKHENSMAKAEGKFYAKDSNNAAVSVTLIYDPDESGVAGVSSAYMITESDSTITVSLIS